MAKKKKELEDDNICPYCGKTGVVANKYDDGSKFVVHSVATEKIKSKSSGKLIECSVLKLACTKYGQVGVEAW